MANDVVVGNYTYATTETGGVHTQKTIAVADTATSATALTFAAATGQRSLVSANPSRKGLYVYNDSDSILFVSLRNTAGPAAFNFKLQPGAFYEMPSPIYTGAVTVYWEAATPTGNVVGTELI